MKTNQTQSGHSPATAALDSAIQVHLGKQLRAVYGDPEDTKLPADLRRLIARLEDVIRAYAEPADKAFVDGIMEAVPSLRAFALSLTKKVDEAEDLVQDTVLKALRKRGSFETGTNLSAWLFTILRNGFLSQLRKKEREVEDADGVHASTLIVIPDQIANLEMRDFSLALEKLPKDMQDAIMLVGAEGMSYEEAAETLHVAVGTIKSRVNRARNRLAELLQIDDDSAGGNRLSST